MKAFQREKVSHSKFRKCNKTPFLRFSNHNESGLYWLLNRSERLSSEVESLTELSENRDCNLRWSAIVKNILATRCRPHSELNDHALRSVHKYSSTLFVLWMANRSKKNKRKMPACRGHTSRRRVHGYTRVSSLPSDAWSVERLHELKPYFFNITFHRRRHYCRRVHPRPWQPAKMNEEG